MKGFSQDSALATDVNGERGRSLTAQVDRLDHVHAGVLGHAGGDVQGDETEVLGDVESGSHLLEQIRLSSRWLGIELGTFIYYLPACSSFDHDGRNLALR